MPYKEPGKKGKWRAVVMVDGKRLPTRLCNSRKEAKAWEDALRESESQTGTDLLDTANKYLDYSENEYIPATFRLKKGILKKFIAFLPKDTTIEDITRAQCQEYLLEVLRLKGPGQSNDSRKHIGAFLRWARGTYGTPNPMDSIKALKAPGKVLPTPTEEDVSAVLEASRGEETVFLHCYLYTAAREQEINHLAWDDVDFEGGRIRLWSRKSRSRQYLPRWISMAPTLARSLNWWKENTSTPAAATVFANNQETASKGKTYVCRRKFLTAICKRAGVEPFSFHPIRRFVGSFLAKDGVPMREIQHVLGHATLAHTEKYVKGLDVDTGNAIDRLEKHLTRELTHNPSRIQ